MKDTISDFEELVKTIIYSAGSWYGYENSPDKKVSSTAKRHVRQAAILLRTKFHELEKEK